MPSKVIDIYGVSHSPWVQAACLTAHRFDHKFHLHSIPSFKSLHRSGFIMPVLLDPLIVDSFQIMEHLSPSLFATEIDPQQVRADATNLFYHIGTSRINSLYKYIVQFPTAWSEMYETHDSVLVTILNFFFRPLIAIFFWIFIVFGKFIFSFSTKRPLKDKAIYVLNKLEGDVDNYMYGSDVLTFADVVIFGQMQCLYSGLTDDVLPILDAFPKIQAWLSRMNDEFKSYPILYSRRMDNMYDSPDGGNLMMQFCFWVGFLLYAYFWMYTLFIILFFLVYRYFVSTSVEKMVNRKRKHVS